MDDCLSQFCFVGIRGNQYCSSPYFFHASASSALMTQSWWPCSCSWYIVAKM
jgi:hypothetical protein